MARSIYQIMEKAAGGGSSGNPASQGTLMGTSNPINHGPQGQHVSSTGVYDGRISHGKTESTLRVGIGGANGKGINETGGKFTDLSSLQKQNWVAKIDFNLKKDSRHKGIVPKHETDAAEITGLYGGSNDNINSVGVTSRISAVTGKTDMVSEDHYKPHNAPGQYRGLCPKGKCGGVSKVPELANNGGYTKQWSLILTGSHDAQGNVYYKSYAEVDGRMYLTGDLKNPRMGGAPGEHGYDHNPNYNHTIDYDNSQATFIRGRANFVDPSSSATMRIYALGNKTYDPGTNVISSDK